MHPEIAALVKNLHDGRRLAYDDLSTVVLCPRGVRQGCESGPMIFNSIYQSATEAVKDKLRDKGIVDSVVSITTLKKFWVFTSWTMAPT